MSDYQELKQKVWAANMELPQRGLVIYTFGNVSAIDRELGVIAIKPSGVPYSDLKADDIVVLDLDGNTVEGELRPSSDTKTHLVLYRHFPEIGGVVHTHATYSVAWSQARVSLPIYGTTHADHLPVDVPCTLPLSRKQIKGDYEEETGNQILQAFKKLSYREIEMVLVAGHGPFTWGKTAAKAVYNSVVLEELAKMALLTRMINPQAPKLGLDIINKHYQRKHGKNAYYGQK